MEIQKLSACLIVLSGYLVFEIVLFRLQLKNLTVVVLTSFLNCICWNEVWLSKGSIYMFWVFMFFFIYSFFCCVCVFVCGVGVSLLCVVFEEICSVFLILIYLGT